MSGVGRGWGRHSAARDRRRRPGRDHRRL